MKNLLLILIVLVAAAGQSVFCQNSEVNSIAEEWSVLSDSIKGCTVSGEYCKKGSCGGEGCCFDISKKWQSFFNHDKDQLSNFLLSQLSDTSESSIHICPYFNATKGELAIYCLQRIYKTNWYVLDKKYKKIKDGSFIKDDDLYYSIQNELQMELKNKIGLELLTKRWGEIISKN